MRKVLCVLLLFFSSVLFCGSSLALPQQDDIPVKIKANKLTYVEDGGIIKAQGSVEVYLEDATILADLVFIDPKTNIATAEGNVKLLTNDYDALCDQVTYDITVETASFDNFKANSKGLYLYAGKLDELNTKMLGENGGVSTCDYASPHFYMAAQKMEYYPDERIIGYNSTLYIGDLPVFWTPYMYYDLGKKRSTNWMFGHNYVEGNYLKSSWQYPLGLLYVDLMEKKGLGLGTNVGYSTAALGAGSIFLYHVQEKDTGLTDWVTKISGTKQLNPETTLSYGQRYASIYLIPSGRQDQTAFNVALSNKGKATWNYRLDTLDDRMANIGKLSFSADHSYNRMSTQYNFNYDYAKTDPRWIHSSQRLTHTQPLWADNVMLAARFNYSNNIAQLGEAGDQKLEPIVEITGKEPGYSWKMIESWYMDLDGDSYTADSAYQYLEKLPEIDINLDPQDLKLFTLRPSFGYGYYREVRYVAQLAKNRDFAAQRYKTTLNADKTFPLGLGTSLALGVGLDQFAYGPGDQLYAYRENGALRTELGNCFRNDISYRKGLTDGNTPFLFDQLGTRYHSMDERMSFYYKNNFDWTTTGGFNWQTGKWLDVMSGMVINPDPKYSLSLHTGWDLENRLYKDLVSGLRIYPYSFFWAQFASVSNLNDGQLKSANILYDLILLEGQRNQWKIKLGQVYDNNTKEFKVRDIMIVRDLHCWEMMYTYSDYRKEFSFTFTLKAFPGEPVGYSAGRGFHYDSIETQAKGIIPEGSVQRY